jgi:hypothetical protein
MMDIRMMMRYGLLPKGMKIVQSEAEADPGAGDAAAADGSAEAPADPYAISSAPSQTRNTNEVSSIKLTCRAISWARVRPAVDTQLQINLRDALLRSPLFLSGTNGTQLAGEVRTDESTNTFRFDVLLKLAKPIKL